MNHSLSPSPLSLFISHSLLSLLSSFTDSLVSDRHIQSNAEYIRLQEEKAKSGDKTIEVAVLSGENYQKEKPRVKKEKASTEEAGPSGTAEGAVPLINIQDYGLLLPHQQNEEEEEEGEGGQDNDESKSDIIEVGSVVSEADSAAAIGNSPELNPDSKGIYSIF